MKIVQRILGRDLSNRVKVRDVVGVRENMRVSVEMFEQCCALGRGGALASAEGARGALVGGGRWSRTGPRLRTAAHLSAAGRPESRDGQLVFGGMKFVPFHR